jgi:hypothetical protein
LRLTASAAACWERDPGLFGAGEALAERPPTFLFVGQFIARKGVLDLAEAFLRIADQHPVWRLSIVGGGKQRNLIPRQERISIEEFVQPEQLADHSGTPASLSPVTMGCLGRRCARGSTVRMRARAQRPYRQRRGSRHAGECAALPGRRGG